jgi:uncharacterized membrane protein YphA (DoxX/SURF4 family)
MADGRMARDKADRDCEGDDMAIGLLLIRLVLGVLMAAHGSQKLFAWFGGYGLTGTGTFFEQLGFRPGRLFAAAAGWTEVLGGVLSAPRRWRLPLEYSLGIMPT